MRASRRGELTVVSPVATDADVVVVGGGLAGATAAIAAARTGARTRLISRASSTLAHASGLVDVLGYTPDGDGPLAEPRHALETLPPTHPYRRAGRDAVASGLALFDDIAGERYRGAHTEANALVPTGAGTLKPTARYPATVAPGLAGRGGDRLLVGFAEFPSFDADLAATHLDRALECSVRGVTVEFPATVDADADATRLATLLEHREGIASELAARVRPHHSGEHRVGLPAVLGRDRPETVRERLAAALEATVFELPLGPPSVPGLRLADLLAGALEDAGVPVDRDSPVVGYDADGDGAIERVSVDRDGTETAVDANQFVLATGGLVGGGVATDRESVREPVFDCRVAHPPDRYDWFDREAFGSHPFARFGVDPDREMRPLDSAGEPCFPNLRAAGAVLGNYDYAAEKSGSGVSLATGALAGRLAGERA